MRIQVNAFWSLPLPPFLSFRRNQPDRAVNRALFYNQLPKIQPGWQMTLLPGVCGSAWCLSWWLIIHVGTGGFPTVQGRRGKEERHRERERRSYSHEGMFSKEWRGAWRESRSRCLPDLLALDVDIRGQSGLSRTRHWNKIPRLHPLPSNIEEKITKCTFC